MTSPSTALRLAAVALALVAQSGMTPVAAQTAQPAKNPPARKGVPPPTTAAQRAALPAADEQQLAAAEFVHYGKYVCDEKIEIFVEREETSLNQILSHWQVLASIYTCTQAASTLPPPHPLLSVCLTV